MRKGGKQKEVEGRGQDCREDKFIGGEWNAEEEVGGEA